MVLARLKALLERLERRFEFTEEERQAPKGTVLWQQYATCNLPRARFLAVPCVFPELRDDRHLKGTIRFAIERQIRSLETQRGQGTFVHLMIELGEHLLQKVRAVPACRPTPRDMDAWLRRPLRSDVFLEGLQAIDWTAQERGLAGLSELEGIPWTMPMEAFFEAWVETVLRAVAVRIGGCLKVGRQRQTVVPLAWEPPYLGSQKSLIPDFVLELEGCTVIVDAKYKRHWEEFQRGQWARQEDELREQHRQDMLQALAYANLSETTPSVCCLLYPCSFETWNSLLERRRLFHRAELQVRSRRVLVWLSAIPMCASAERIAGPLVDEIRRTAWPGA